MRNMVTSARAAAPPQRPPSKQHQAEYYRRFWRHPQRWGLKAGSPFFLEGVAVAAAEAERSIVAIASQVTADRAACSSRLRPPGKLPPI